MELLRDKTDIGVLAWPHALLTATEPPGIHLHIVVCGNAPCGGADYTLTCLAVCPSQGRPPRVTGGAWPGHRTSTPLVSATLVRAKVSTGCSPVERWWVSSHCAKSFHCSPLDKAVWRWRRSLGSKRNKPALRGTLKGRWRGLRHSQPASNSNRIVLLLQLQHYRLKAADRSYDRAQASLTPWCQKQASPASPGSIKPNRYTAFTAGHKYRELPASSDPSVGRAAHGVAS